MKIEIWSDVACPFCYIGKRRLEEALHQFEHKDEVKIEWKSYQLNPGLKSEPGKSLNDYLMTSKGWTREYTEQAQEHVASMASEVGLEYHLDKAFVANTGKAHQLIQLAKTKGLDSEIEEIFFKAYFTDGKNLEDTDTLIQLATEAGLDANEAAQVIQSDQYKEKIESDLYEAMQIGVRGVPFFVFNNKFGISGAQPLEVFTRTLDQAYESK